MRINGKIIQHVFNMSVEPENWKIGVEILQRHENAFCADLLPNPSLLAKLMII